jgi:hypothetical protein
MEPEDSPQYSQKPAIIVSDPTLNDLNAVLTLTHYFFNTHFHFRYKFLSQRRLSLGLSNKILYAYLIFIIYAARSILSAPSLFLPEKSR